MTFIKPLPIGDFLDLLQREMIVWPPFRLNSKRIIGIAKNIHEDDRADPVAYPALYMVEDDFE